MSTARLVDAAAEDKAPREVPLAVLGAVVGTASALITAIITASLIALVLSGCADGLGQPGDIVVDDPPTLPSPPIAEEDLAAPPLRSPCPGTDAAFAYRALRLFQGRRPYGVRELDLLAEMIRTLDDAGLPGREFVARGLAEGDRYRQHWHGVLLDLLRIPRLGQTADIGCYARMGDHPQLAEGPELAAWIRDAAPGDSPNANLGGWTMADLLGSSLHLGDLSPLLRAHLIIRNARPLAGNNVDPQDLERAGRVFLGRGFEAAFLGRRLECIRCHDGGGATVLDALDPADDRTWPVIPGLEDSVYGATHLADESSAYAVFRVAGVVDRGRAPWGASDECPRLALTSAEQGADPLGDAAHLGGPLPQGASVVDLEAALHRGLDVLREEGLPAGAGEANPEDDENDPEAALAAMVAIHLADAAWREASGHRLTMSHGQPRNPIQEAVLRELSTTFVRDSYSLRELLVAIATHPLLDQGEPSACGEELPALFDPFQPSNDAGDLVRREDAWRLLDSAAIALGWPTMQRFPLNYGWADETLIRSLGGFIDETEPGHHGVDVVSALAWEAAVGDGTDPLWRGPPTTDADGDVLSRLVDLAAADPDATVRELAIAVEDRILQESALTGPPSPLRDQQRAAVEELLELPLEAPIADLAGDPDGHDELLLALRRFAGALLATPQFTLAGLPPPPLATPPRLVLPEATREALCEALAPAIFDPSGLSWNCDEQGRVLIDGD